MSLLPAGLRLYRLLLFLYPREFRRAYGEEMCLLFREMCVQARHRSGLVGVVSFWLEAICDVLWSVFLLHRERVAVSALASALAILVYGVALLLIEPRVSCASDHAQSGPLAFGIGVQGTLLTLALGWMCVFCCFLFFPGGSREAVVLNLVEPTEAAGRSSTRVYLGA